MGLQQKIEGSSKKTMGYAKILSNWNKDTYVKGLSQNCQSILEEGLIPRGKEKDKAREAVFLSPTNPFGNGLVLETRWARMEEWYSCTNPTVRITSMRQRCRSCHRRIKIQEMMMRHQQTLWAKRMCHGHRDCHKATCHSELGVNTV